MLLEHAGSGGVGLIYEAFDLLVYLFCSLLAVGFGEGHLRAAGRIVIRYVADLIAHAEIGHHGVCLTGEFLQVVEGAGRYLAIHQLLCHAAADGGSHLVEQLLAGSELTLFRQIPRCAKGLSARDNGHLEQRIGMRQDPADSGMSGLMVGYGLFLGGGDYLALTLQTTHYPVYRIQEILLVYESLIVTCGNQSRLVADIGDVGTGEAGSLLGQELHVEAGGQFDLAKMYLEYLQTLFELGQIHMDLAVKAAGTHQRAVEHIGTVGGSQHYHAGVAAKAVHLGEQLVEGVLPLVVARESDVLAARTAHSIYLVNEHDARGFLLGLTEQVAHAGRAHAHEHLHEVGTRDGEERDVGLACHSLCQQGLAGAGRAHQKGAFGYLATKGRVFLGILQEVHDLHHLDLGLFETCDILECDLILIFLVVLKQLGLRLADIENAAADTAATHVAHGEHEQHDKEDHHQDDPYPVHDVGPAAGALFDYHLEAVQLGQLLQHGVEFRLGIEGVGHQEIEIRAVLGLRILGEIILEALGAAVLDVYLTAVGVADIHQFLHTAGAQYLVTHLKPLFLDGVAPAAGRPEGYQAAEYQGVDQYHRPAEPAGLVAAGTGTVAPALSEQSAESVIVVIVVCVVTHRLRNWFFLHPTRGPRDGRNRDIHS